MTVVAFEGGAGCGKTHRLIESLGDALDRRPLLDGQRVLATTYMHGSRRRLDARLFGMKDVSRRYECSTLDSIAWRWVWRWRTLAARIAGQLPAQENFDAVCGLAGRLLDHDHVRAWATVSFPIVLVDEAQDLTVERLGIVQKLARQAHLLVAADEFQCLQEALRPNPFEQWSAAALEPEKLAHVWRTDVADLLGAAQALRAGGHPAVGKDLKIVTTQSAALAGAYLSNQIGWYAKGGFVAVLTPSITQFVTDTVEWAQRNRTNKGNGPFSIAWERSDSKELEDLCATLEIPEIASIAVAITAVKILAAPHVVPYVCDWIAVQRNVLGRREVMRQEIEKAIERALLNRRRFGKRLSSRLAAMSIHAAKNREFDGVVVLWPYQVAGNDEQKRRLLYNAITRARRWCMILVQGKAIMNAAPFA